MKKGMLLLVFALLLAGCGSSEEHAPEPATETASDYQVIELDGTRFEAPSAWDYSVSDNVVLFTPNGDNSVLITTGITDGSRMSDPEIEKTLIMSGAQNVVKELSGAVTEDLDVQEGDDYSIGIAYHAVDGKEYASLCSFISDNQICMFGITADEGRLDDGVYFECGRMIGSMNGGS